MRPRAACRSRRCGRASRAISTWAAFLGLDPSVRNGFRQIRVAFEIDGDLTAGQKADLIRMAEARSPVFDIVSNGVLVACALAG